MIRGKTLSTKNQSSKIIPKKTNNGVTKITEKKTILKSTIKENETKETFTLDKSKLNPQQKIVNKPLESSSKLNSKSSIIQPQVELFTCKQCGRSFIQQSLKRHQKICKKIFIKKRNPFNSAKQRISTKEQQTMYKKNQSKNNFENKKSQTLNIKGEMPEWKRQSMALRMAMKKMRGAKISEEEVKTIQKIEQQNLFKCKFCGKKFNQETGKRHQVFCEKKSKDMKNRIKGK